MGNTVDATVNRMKCKKGRDDGGKEDQTRELNDRAIQAYLNLSNDPANKERSNRGTDSPDEEDVGATATTRFASSSNGHGVDDDLFNKQLSEIQKAAQDIYDMIHEVKTCDVGNIIHTATLQRIAEAHADQAKQLRDRLANETNGASTNGRTPTRRMESSTLQEQSERRRPS